MFGFTKKHLLLIAPLAIFAFTLVMPVAQDASALSGSSFNPGRIIDDSVFYNNQSMTAEEIQTFLNSKSPNCDYNGTKPASDWGYPNLTHAQFAEKLRTGAIVIKNVNGADFHPPPYRCPAKYTQTTPQMEAASGYCSALSSATRTAAQIIKDIANACGINPQVLIVLLEKEQSLITDSWPLDRQLRNATGFACPDTAPCNPAYEGFFYQVYYAARQFKVYKANPASYNYMAGRTNKIYYQTNLGEFINPTGNANDPSRTGQSGCGYRHIYIENQATAALYIYTPYQPNQNALNNLRGTGDGCSAYGNRNFWRLFTDWFGSTQQDRWLSMSNRYLRLNKDTRMINADTGAVDTAVKTKGLIPYFTAKTILSDGRQCLRPQGHTIMCVLWSDLSETTQWESMGSRYLAISPTSTTSVDVDTLQPQGDSLSKNQIFYFTSKAILPNGDQCLRTEANTNTANGSCILWSQLREEWLPMGDRYLKLNKDTRMINADTGAVDSVVKAKGLAPFFNAQAILTNGKQCLRPVGHTKMCILFEDLDETTQWESMGSRYLAISVPSATPVNVDTLQPAGSALLQNQIFYFTSKAILPNGDQCLRTEANTNTANGSCILWSQLREEWLPMGDRYLKLNKDTRMINADTGAVDSVVKAKGITPFFNAKTFLTDGRQCLRPVGHTSMCILWEDLAEIN